jgi:hypothetical protein
MRSLKYLLLLAALALPATYSQAQVSIGVQVGAPPVCEYGYYDYSPYACAPYGYWGPEWFADGFFIGAGPWYHYYYRHPEFFVGGFGGWRRFDHDRGFDRGRFDRDRRFEGRRSDHGFDRDGFQHFNGGHANNGFRGGSSFQGRETSRGGGGFRGGESFRGGNRSEGSSYRGGGNSYRGGGDHGGGSRGGGGSYHGGGGQSGGSHGGGRSGGGHR